MPRDVGVALLDVDVAGAEGRARVDVALLAGAGRHEEEEGLLPVEYEGRTCLAVEGIAG